MKFLVTSDTHGNDSLLVRACDIAMPFDTLIHLGDCAGDADMAADAFDIAVVSVAGNCDQGSRAPRERLLECEGQRLLLTHGDRYGVKSGAFRLEQRAMELGAHAALFGHSHIATITTLSGILFINPGSLSAASRVKSVALLDVTPAGIAARLLEIS